MSPEDIARRFERRPGYELVDYAEVALPLYRLSVDAVTMVHREIPPIKDFVMRSISAGLSYQSEIAGFLGLDEAVVDATVKELRSDRYIADLEEGAVSLSERGRDVLKKAQESSPQDEMLVFLYDRLLQKPVRLTAEELLAPSNVDPQRMIEIRPYPAEGPDVGELSMPDVLQVVEQQSGGRAAFGRDLLRLKRVARRMRIFRPAVALVFKKIRSSEIQVEFILDDVRHEGLSHIFAERGGPKKMGFVKSIDASMAAADLRRYLGPDVQSLLTNPAGFEEKRIAVSTARIKHQTAVARSERYEGLVSPESEQVMAAVLESEIKLTEAEEELKTFPARPVMPFELTERLHHALTATRRFLMISSKTVDRSVVDAIFLNRLEELLKGGVRVVISLTDSVNAESPALDLERLRTTYPTLELLSGRRGHFHLVCDEEFAVVSNRPLLGNLGKVRTLQHVVGYLLQRPDLVAAFTARIEATGALPKVGGRPKPLGRS